MIPDQVRHCHRHAVRAQRCAIAAAAMTIVIGLTGVTARADAGTTASAAAGATDLLFREFYRTPVGPSGLEPSAKLLGLAGQTVRLRGYVVQQAEPTPGVLILSPVPVQLGDADESLSDDLPPTVVFVHYDGAAMAGVSGLVQVVGTLSVGPSEEADGHVSQVRLSLSPSQAAEILRIVPSTTVLTATPRPSR